LAQPGLDEMTGRGVYYGSTLTEAAACTGQDVYIVGGANSGRAGRRLPGQHAKSVTILCRGVSLEAVDVLLPHQQIRETGNISVRICTEVIAARAATTWRA
jgi:thioredoxin reductase (NADPH)